MWLGGADPTVGFFSKILAGTHKYRGRAQQNMYSSGNRVARLDESVDNLQVFHYQSLGEGNRDDRPESMGYGMHSNHPILLVGNLQYEQLEKGYQIKRRQAGSGKGRFCGLDVSVCRKATYPQGERRSGSFRPWHGPARIMIEPDRKKAEGKRGAGCGRFSGAQCGLARVECPGRDVKPMLAVASYHGFL